MAQFQGKYQLVEHQNFYEFLVKSGVPEDAAKERSEDKPTLEISTDDKKIKLETKGKTTNNVSNLLLDGEVEENIGTYKMKTASKLNGNVLVVDSKTPDGLTLKRSYKFTDTGIELELTSNKGGTTKSIYKKIE